MIAILYLSIHSGLRVVVLFHNLTLKSQRTTLSLSYFLKYRADVNKDYLFLTLNLLRGSGWRGNCCGTAPPVLTYRKTARQHEFSDVIFLLIIIWPALKARGECLPWTAAEPDSSGPFEGLPWTAAEQDSSEPFEGLPWTAAEQDSSEPFEGLPWTAAEPDSSEPFEGLPWKETERRFKKGHMKHLVWFSIDLTT